jgi:short-subunit dehydrogenase
VVPGPYARRLAAKGCDVTLVARPEPEMVAPAAHLREHFQVQTHVVVADLATPEGVDQAISRSATAPVDWLINNAGFGVPGVFDQVPVQWR